MTTTRNDHYTNEKYNYILLSFSFNYFHIISYFSWLNIFGYEVPPASKTLIKNWTIPFKNAVNYF